MLKDFIFIKKLGIFTLIVAFLGGLSFLGLDQALLGRVYRSYASGKQEEKLGNDDFDEENGILTVKADTDIEKYFDVGFASRQQNTTGIKEIALIRCKINKEKLKRVKFETNEILCKKREKYLITSIGDYCFEYCSNLQTILLSNTLRSIGNCCFQSCSSLQTISLPNTLTSIGDYCFEYCSNLQTISLPNTLRSIGDCCFRNCKSLQTILLSNTLRSIGNCCFQSCSSLQTISLPNTLTSIGDYCFEYCSNLQTISLPNTLKNIGNRCFYDCKSLQTISFPNNYYLNIGNECFASLQKVKFNIKNERIFKNIFESIGNNFFYFRERKWWAEYIYSNLEITFQNETYMIDANDIKDVLNILQAAEK